MYFLVSPLQINIHLDVYADVPNAQLTIKKTPNCSYWSILLAWRKSTTYQFYCLWLDPTYRVRIPRKKKSLLKIGSFSSCFCTRFLKSTN